jgi:hypothetical protein
MTSHLAPNPLTFAPQAQRETMSVDRLPAAPGAVQRFELLMYSPASPGGGASVAATSGLERSGLRHYVEGLSRRWEAGQTALKRMTDAGEYSSKELIQTQIQMINCALDVEVSSKCASMFENGVQTLVQRGS